MDCAKGINFLLTNGGQMKDYWGVDKATKPMLPLIAVPTTAGTGSEAQSGALITDPETHQKMACGDEKAAAARGDPRPRADRDAAAKGGGGDRDRRDRPRGRDRPAARSATTTSRRAVARGVAVAVEPAFERVAARPVRRGRRAAAMLLGAHLAGAAIENSMLGAAHALREPADGLLRRRPRARGRADAAARRAVQLVERAAAVCGSVGGRGSVARQIEQSCWRRGTSRAG